ncbi:MAG: hypothetical protein PHN98_08245 [Smithellaceae bacterium]|nr:hypothetical protein [Smithellaceae bacterium]
MKTRILLLILSVSIFGLLSGTGTAYAKQEDESKTLSYKLPVTRNGVTITKVAIPFWQSEYPGPVIDVRSKKSGTMTVQAYQSLRKPDSPVACTIKHGIYHPWSKTKNSVIHYYTITAVEDYKALKTAKLEEYTIHAGDIIANVVYFSEGFCKGNLKNRQIEFTCSALQENPQDFQLLGKADNGSRPEQWLHVKCEEGREAFIQDAALLNTKEVKKGVIIKYGEVGP